MVPFGDPYNPWGYGTSYATPQVILVYTTRYTTPTGTDSLQYFDTNPYGYCGPLPSVEMPDLRPPPRPWIRSSTGRPPSSLGRRYRRVLEHAPGGLVLKSCSLRDRRRNKRRFSKQQIWRNAGL